MNHSQIHTEEIALFFAYVSFSCLERDKLF